jgi:hypothetical protein
MLLDAQSSATGNKSPTTQVDAEEDTLFILEEVPNDTSPTTEVSDETAGLSASEKPHGGAQMQSEVLPDLNNDKSDVTETKEPLAPSTVTQPVMESSKEANAESDHAEVASTAVPSTSDDPESTADSQLQSPIDKDQGGNNAPTNADQPRDMLDKHTNNQSNVPTNTDMDGPNQEQVKDIVSDIFEGALVNTAGDSLMADLDSFQRADHVAIVDEAQLASGQPQVHESIDMGSQKSSCSARRPSQRQRC